MRQRSSEVAGVGWGRMGGGGWGAEWDLSITGSDPCVGEGWSNLPPGGLPTGLPVKLRQVRDGEGFCPKP